MKGAAGEEARATMSLRPSERAEVRRSCYKVAVDAEEDRRRREDNMVEIRKSRREESLLKKRRDGLPPSVAAAAPQMAHSSALQQKIRSRLHPHCLASSLPDVSPRATPTPSEWYKPGCLLEYPLGGSGAIIDDLVRGIEKFGGRLALCSHVENILIENGRAVGVKLRSGQVPGSVIWRWIRLFVPEDAAVAL